MNIYEFNLRNLDFRNKTIFDCAIGSAESTFHWAKAIHDSGGSSKITGFDLELNENDIEAIYNNLGNYRKYVTVERNDITNLAKYENESIDYINCDDTLVFLASEIGKTEMAFSEFYRLLKPKGKLIINSEIAIEWSDEKYIQNQYRRWNFAKAIYSFQGKIWSIEPNKDSITSLLKKIGFVLIETQDFQLLKQNNPIPSIQEWMELMKSEIDKLHFTEILKSELINEIQNIYLDVVENGMACPSYYSLILEK